MPLLRASLSGNIEPDQVSEEADLPMRMEWQLGVTAAETRELLSVISDFCKHNSLIHF